jgi:molybdopterin molybdotransferase
VVPLTFLEARETVIHAVRAARSPVIEETGLLDAMGRVLAETVAADRDSPAVSRSASDGFAVRAADLPGDLEVAGEVRAGESFAGEVGAGQAVAIMTGAPVPLGADAVAMVENTVQCGARVRISETAQPGKNINPRGCEAAAGEPLLHPGKRLDFTDIALLAAVGRTHVSVYRKPVVAIVPTGDEVVDVAAVPRDYQVRNSNAYALAAQVIRAGGRAKILPIARDNAEHTRDMIERGLACDLLLLSGGVSAGKYDVVEPVLHSLGAAIHFDRVLVQPGQPLVFGSVAGRFFFGLPGNPSSTMVTFEVFGRAALELLGGQEETPLYMPLARLTCQFRHRAGLTRFLPARLSGDGAEVTPVAWHGSADIPAMTRSNAFLVADPERPEYAAGDPIRVLIK